MPDKLHARVRACWRTHACAAGICTGAQVFLLGAGCAAPAALNGAWLAALTALPVCAAAVLLCRRNTPLSPGRCALLGGTLLGGAVFALSSLVVFAEQTLLPQSRTLFSAALALCAAALCALSGGTGVCRLLFALRIVLPVGLAALALLSVPLRMPAGLFPLLGTGGAGLGAAALCMPAAALPALTLLLPPQELSRAGEAAVNCPPPDPRFFLWRVLAGAAVGAALTGASCIFAPYESMAQSTEWGARLRIAALYQPHEGLAQTLLTVLELISMALLCVRLLSAAEQALILARPRLARHHTGLLVCVLICAASLLALIVYGFSHALRLAPLLGIPAALVLLPQRKAGMA